MDDWPINLLACMVTITIHPLTWCLGLGLWHVTPRVHNRGCCTSFGGAPAITSGLCLPLTSPLYESPLVTSRTRPPWRQSLTRSKSTLNNTNSLHCYCTNENISMKKNTILGVNLNIKFIKENPSLCLTLNKKAINLYIFLKYYFLIYKKLHSKNIKFYDSKVKHKKKSR